MIRGFALAAALTVGLATGVSAQEAKSTEECLQSSLDIARMAEEKKLADDKLAKIEDVLSKMEGECEAGKFADAAKTAASAKAMIGG